jgi:hypothetical protein
MASVCSSAYEVEALPEMEDEFEGEAHLEDESEDELNPTRKIYPDAVMEHLGELAAEAETEDEAAEHFLPLIGMAASKLLPVVARAVAPAARKALPRIAKAVTRLTPRLTRSVGKLARTLHRNPATRSLLRAVPSIARRTVKSIARQVAHNRPINARTAVRTLARQTQRVLSHPQRRRHALRRHRNLDRRFHYRWGRGIARPHYGAAGGSAPGVPRDPGAPGTPGVSYTRSGVGQPPRTTYGSAGKPPVVTPGRPGYGGARTCRCAPCPVCAGTGAAGSTPAPQPAYCRCCGQVMR